MFNEITKYMEILALGVSRCSIRWLQETLQPIHVCPAKLTAVCIEIHVDAYIHLYIVADVAAWCRGTHVEQPDFRSKVALI